MAQATLENVILILNMFPKSQIETLNHPKWSKQRRLHNCVVMPKPYPNKIPTTFSPQMEPFMNHEMEIAVHEKIPKLN
jgi:hypothetical protein